MLGGQVKAGLILAAIFCLIAYMLLGTFTNNSATAVLSIKPLSWGLFGLGLGWLATSKRHIEVSPSESCK
jgi:hypothetical protein